LATVLGTFEQAILLALVRLRDEAYGRAILKDTQERLQRDVAAGAVYSTLDRLEAKGLISSRLGSGTIARAGRPRRYYTIERPGLAALNESRAAVDTIWHGVRWPVKGRA
jgi:PadR family transcriptional regulator PadR